MISGYALVSRRIGLLQIYDFITTSDYCCQELTRWVYRRLLPGLVLDLQNLLLWKAAELKLAIPMPFSL